MNADECSRQNKVLSGVKVVPEESALGGPSLIFGR
jgi:hypothetical protein